MQGSIRTLLLLTIGSFLIITWITAYIRTLRPPSQRKSIETNSIASIQEPGTSNNSGSAFKKKKKGKITFLSTVKSAIREKMMHCFMLILRSSYLRKKLLPVSF